MAKLLGNTLQGLSGRLGNVVGYTWNGVQCVRSRPTMVRNPRTAAQQAHRDQFRQEVQLAAQMRYALIKGLGAAAKENRMTPQNLFSSYVVSFQVPTRFLITLSSSSSSSPHDVNAKLQHVSISTRLRIEKIFFIVIKI